jgi:hypothetical protein
MGRMGLLFKNPPVCFQRVPYEASKLHKWLMIKALRKSSKIRVLALTLIAYMLICVA